jgi:hypothetical protein
MQTQSCNTTLVCMLSSLLLQLLTLGCSGEVDPATAVAKVNENNIQRLANLYFTFQMKHNWHGPSDEAEFKNFLHNYSPSKLTRIGISPNAIDEIFVSERDGQLFKIRYSVLGSSMGSSEPVVFESVGVGETRQVGFLDMTQREVDAAEYEKLWQGGSNSPKETRAAGRDER